MSTFAQLQKHIERIDNPRELDGLRSSPLLAENEILQATFALAAKRFQLPPYPVKLTPLSSGVVPLFPKSFFPWGALPYPRYHAELGSLLAHLSEEGMDKIVHEMAKFQEATLDHHQKPLASLFQQEGALAYHVLEKANRAFFETVDRTSSGNFEFMEYTLGMVAKRSQTATLVCVASGCKSGMGVFLSHDAGIVNYGPQLLPVGECSGFGLSGKGQNIHLQENSPHFSLSYLCRLGGPSSRPTGFLDLQDSSYSGLWMDVDIEGDLNGISLRCHMEGGGDKKFLFSFFGKGETCLVARSHKLKPRSLDRYQGPPQSINFLGEKGGVRIEGLEGAESMEIIPLAGDESFWGADFLVAYTLTAPLITFGLKRDDLVF